MPGAQHTTGSCIAVSAVCLATFTTICQHYCIIFHVDWLKSQDTLGHWIKKTLGSGRGVRSLILFNPQKLYLRKTANASSFSLPLNSHLSKSPNWLSIPWNSKGWCFFVVHIVIFWARTDSSLPRWFFSSLIPNGVTAFPYWLFFSFLEIHIHINSSSAWKKTRRIKGTGRRILYYKAGGPSKDNEPYKETLALVYKQNSASLFFDWLPASFDICYHQRRA